MSDHFGRLTRAFAELGRQAVMSQAAIDRIRFAAFRHYPVPFKRNKRRYGR